MENLIQLRNEDLELVNGGIEGNYLFAGAIGVTMGIGLIGAACVPGLNVFVAAGLAYAGTWSASLGVTSTIIGIVKK